ncbi:uncharacterized protein si:ch73-204p21.2 [Alosa sapidissima]|uniref:uncharacterized protein si:ch73-204p21.2 n=1 Tax=Alosa sapidissima TaxID=34773 RepID=UPI001C09FBDB|nr:uncharacterized protein si:ch73-204p21.2 [Alosa sapidissima]
MAPLVADLQSWVAGGGSTLTSALSLIFLLVIIVNLINLCTTCQKHTFELEQPSAGVERSSSTLVRVVKLEDARAARENPAIDEIKRDEEELSTIPEGNGAALTPWRNHTSQRSEFPEDSQVSNGTPAGLTVTNGGGKMDGTATTRHELHSTPMIAPHREVESHVQSALPAVSVVSPTHSEPEGSLQGWAKAQPELRANHSGEVTSEHPPSFFQIPEVRSQHDYETISNILKQAAPELSESSGEPLDVPSYQFVTQLEPYATSLPDPTHLPQHTLTVKVEEIADLEDRHSKAMYARVSRRIKCPTPPPVPPPEDEDEEEEGEKGEEIAPPLPDRALDTDKSISQ